MSWRPTPIRVPLRQKVTCPHCFHEFHPQETRWISEHPDLSNDPKLGVDYQQRFLPTRFNLKGEALDDRGFPCNELACPNCHQRIPRSLFEFQAMFWSILGENNSGKTCFLVSMVHSLQTKLPLHFKVDFGHADMEFNDTLEANVQKLFDSKDASKVVVLDKTDAQFIAKFYKVSTIGDQKITFLTPFVFSFKPRRHTADALTRHMSRVLCLYDNAGEHFHHGAVNPLARVTHHLGHSEILLFLFDPTQDSGFREACLKKAVPNVHGRDPLPDALPMQTTADTEILDPQLTTDTQTTTQVGILSEAVERIRTRRGLHSSAPLPCRLMVVATKFDAWKHLFPRELKAPWHYSKTQQTDVFDVRYVASVSRDLRKLLLEHTPKIVTVAESLVDDVYFLPTSASGSAPEPDPETGRLGFRPERVEPIWVEVPILLSLQTSFDGMIPAADDSNK